jgi:ATP-dependent Zn protease
MIITLVTFLVLFTILLGFVWWKPRRKPLFEDRLPPEFIKTEASKAAVHEAGHAVTAWCCTIIISVDEARIDADGGLVRWMMRDYNSSDVRWCNLVISMAGAAAEIAVFGKVRTGESKKDLLAARSKAEELVGKGDDTSPWRKRCVVAESLPFAQIYVPAITSEEELILRNAYIEAKTIVRAHGERFYQIVSALLAKGTLKEHDLEKILRKRTFIQLVGMMRPTFIFPKGNRQAA